jgi:hypothetical protein
VDLESVVSEVRPMVTTTSHVKERGLVRKYNAHCEVFLRKGKGAKGMSTEVVSATARDGLMVTAEND